MEFEEQAFSKFLTHLESIASIAQLQTAYKLWERTRSRKTFTETESQVGTGDLDRKIQEDLKAYEEET